MSRPLGKDKPGELNHQISAIFKFTKLIMNRLIEDIQLPSNPKHTSSCASPFPSPNSDPSNTQDFIIFKRFNNTAMPIPSINPLKYASAILLLLTLCSCLQAQTPTQIKGVFPQMAIISDHKDRTEAGIGAVIP